MHGLTKEGEGDLISGDSVTVGGNDFDRDEGTCLGGWIAEVCGGECI